MKTSLFIAVRAIIVLVVGVLLIRYREQMMTWLTITIGGLFLVSGVVSCLGYYFEKERVARLQAKLVPGETLNLKKPVFPVVGLGSILLGIILAMIPNTFITGLVYVLGALLILGAINQFMNLAASRRYGHVPFFFWIFPTVTLVFALILMAKPMEAASLPLLVVGWLCVFYAVIELTILFRMVRMKRIYDKQNPVISATPIADDIEDAEIIEEK